jgi:hypothetical protein
MERIATVESLIEHTTRKPRAEEHVIRAGPNDHDFIRENPACSAPRMFHIHDRFLVVKDRAQDTEFVMFGCIRKFAINEAQKFRTQENSKLIFVACDGPDLLNRCASWLDLYSRGPAGGPGGEAPPAEYVVISNLSHFLSPKTVRATRQFEKQELRPVDAASLMSQLYYDKVRHSKVPHVVLFNLFECLPYSGPGEYRTKLWFFDFLRNLNCPIGALYSMWGAYMNRFINTILQPSSSGTRSANSAQLAEIYTAMLVGNDRMETIQHINNFNRFHNDISSEIRLTVRNGERVADTAGSSAPGTDEFEFDNAGSRKNGRLISDVLRAYATILNSPIAGITILFVQREPGRSQTNSDSMIRIMVEKNIFATETRYLNYEVAAAGAAAGAGATRDTDDDD